MQPRSYLVFKWIVYSLATSLLLIFQSLVLSQVEVRGLTPVLYPLFSL